MLNELCIVVDKFDHVLGFANKKLFHELGINNTFVPLNRIHFLGRVLYTAPNEPCTQTAFAEHEVDYILVSVLDPVASKLFSCSCFPFVLF
ncbi:unnamed protein product [Schistosoma curassoni]|uniref:RCK N-terminal domain-containing protein n=1 Tax=Schistosoma curassoni TaxID=6186 RepID=A0A183KEF5_9TREM|nr:unnamed protein product [Schistosoma curassoni]